VLHDAFHSAVMRYVSVGIKQSHIIEGGAAPNGSVTIWPNTEYVATALLL